MGWLYRKIDRWGWLIAPLVILLALVGFYGQPALWVPLVLIFLVAWIMGVRDDRKAELTRKRR